MYLRILLEIHVSGFVSQHPHVSQERLLGPCLRIRKSASICISGSSARSMSPIHVSASLYLRVLCKIHVFGFMSQHNPISGFSARSMSSDSCLSIHVSASSNLRILCKIHVSDSCLSIHVSASLYLRNLCKIHVSGSMSQHLYISGASARSMSPIHVSASLYLRVLCKIHVSDSRLSIHVSASIYISGSSARSMSPESQHLCISGFSTRSMSSDSCLSIH